MEKIRHTIFYIAGMITLLVQVFGIFVILTLIGAITKNWLVVTIISVVIVLVDIWKHLYYKKQGFVATLGKYIKKEN